jgi:very-short-patch-repair endonuclease
MSCRAIFQIHKVRPVASKSESIFGDLLESAGLNIMRQYRIGRYVCDFYIPRTNRVIEYDGDYWHAKTATKAKDKRKDEWLLAHGYSVTRVSESVAKEPVVIREIVKANTADMHAIAWRTVPCEWRVEMSQGGSR